MRVPLLPSALLLGLLVTACGKDAAPPAAAASGAPPASALTPWEQAHGVGPITTPVTLGPVDRHMAEEGKEYFETHCASCHKANERYVGPALGGVVDRRGPEYVMNMVLDPTDMVRKHPEAKKLFATFMVEMPNLNLTQEQARQVMEYLRTLPAPPATPAQ
ncbi:MAG TPA: cytochrome c [Gemmatimonadales bacterium]|nr:cytochrome c [Gemmatimonadales bacterium]